MLVLSLAGCTAAAPRPSEPYPPDPDARTHWELGHRVVDVKGLSVVGQRIGHDDESTSVRLVDAATQESEVCHVTLFDRGHGGPGNMVGEQIVTTYDGHPAVRNGGAEGAYLMWRLEDESWLQVACENSAARTAVDRVAAAVDLEPTPLMIPFDVELPEGYGVSSISNDLDQPSGRIHLGRVGRQPGPPGPELVVISGAPEVSSGPTGRPATVDGRAVQIDDTATSPVVWVPEQGRWIYVGVETGDTGPYPDRSSELPALESLAERISFAADLTDPITWVPADGVFG